MCSQPFSGGPASWDGDTIKMPGGMQVCHPVGVETGGPDGSSNFFCFFSQRLVFFFSTGVSLMKKSFFCQSPGLLNNFWGCNQCNLPIFCLVSTFLPH